MLAEPANKLVNGPAAPNRQRFKFFLQPDITLPLSSASPPQLSLSLWHCPPSNSSSGFWATETPMSVSSRFTGSQSLKANLSHKSEDLDDVDTSLHL